MRIRAIPLADRMAMLAGREDECWLWPGHVHPKTGYATTSVVLSGVRYPRMLIHRAAYTIAFGSIPGGLPLDHTCRNRRCFNPRHLEPVTSQENNLRSRSPSAFNAKRTHCANGHELTGDNVYLQPRPGGKVKRRCRTCDRERGRRDRLKPEILEYRRQWWQANKGRYSKKKTA